MFLENWGSIPTNKGIVLNIFQIIKAVMLSAAEAELGAFFINVKMAVSMQQTLKEPGHPQPRTPIQTDNSKAHALLSKYHAKSIKVNGYVLHMAEGPRREREVPTPLLEAGHTELGRLLQNTTLQYGQQYSHQPMTPNKPNSSGNHKMQSTTRKVLQTRLQDIY